MAKLYFHTKYLNQVWLWQIWCSYMYYFLYVWKQLFKPVDCFSVLQFNIPRIAAAFMLLIRVKENGMNWWRGTVVKMEIFCRIWTDIWHRGFFLHCFKNFESLEHRNYTKHLNKLIWKIFKQISCRITRGKPAFHIFIFSKLRYNAVLFHILKNANFFVMT